MSNVDFGRYRKIVKYFWDPEPHNDDPSQSPIWCLGREYTARPWSRGGRSKSTQHTPDNDSPSRHREEGSYVTPEKTDHVCANGGRETSPGRADEEEEGGWPREFLDDFESKIWFTYRSGFPAIKKSTDPKASASMSLSVRLRSQLDQGGFTSDTGWGCMIRSGQSLLANALLMLRLGRGMMNLHFSGDLNLTGEQIGEEVPRRTRRGGFCPYSPMIRKHPSHYKGS